MSTDTNLMSAPSVGCDRQHLREAIRKYFLAAGDRSKEECLFNNLLEQIYNDKISDRLK